MDLSELFLTFCAPRNKKYVHCGSQAPRTAAGQDKEDHEVGWGRESKLFNTTVDMVPSSHKTTTQMISAEAPVLFAKAAEMFIHELTMRAWIHTEVSYLLTTSENCSTLLDQLNWFKMSGQQEEDSSEKRHCHGHHQIWPVWLPNRHSAQVLYVVYHTLLPWQSGFSQIFYQLTLLLFRDDIKPTTKREESSVRMVPDQVSFTKLFS